MSEPEPIDLSQLQNINLRPDWVDDLQRRETASGEVIWGRAPESPGGEAGGRGRQEGRGFGPRREGGGPRRDDRRGGGFGNRGPRDAGRQDRGPRPGGGPEGGFGPKGRGPRQDGKPPFERGGRPRARGERPERSLFPLPGWQVKLLPEPRSLEAITRQIKTSGRAYPVFELGRLFLAERDRYIAHFSRKPAASPLQGQKNPKNAAQGAEAQAPRPAEPEGPKELFQCEADGSLWVTRQEAINHLLHSPALDHYYRRESVKVDPPKGNYTSVAVCGFSGALLGPPNHHAYQTNVARLHRERFSNMPLERYKSRIRIERDEATLAKWQESQSVATHYIPVQEGEGAEAPAAAQPVQREAAPPAEEGAEAAAENQRQPEETPAAPAGPAPLKSFAEMEAHFRRHYADKAVRVVTEAKVPGNIPGRLLSPQLLDLLRAEVEAQHRFPMQLVQDLCRELEKQHLKFFKRDKKATYVSRSRPQFLDKEEHLSPRIRSIVGIVRANPGISYARLVSLLAPQPEPSAITAATEAEKAIEAAAAAAPATGEAAASAPVKETEKVETPPVSEAPAGEVATEAPASAPSAETPAAVEAPAASEAAATEAPVSAGATSSEPAATEAETKAEPEAGEESAPVSGEGEAAAAPVAETAVAPAPETEKPAEVAAEAPAPAGETPVAPEPASASAETAPAEPAGAEQSSGQAETGGAAPTASASADAAPAQAPVHLSLEEIAVLQDIRWLVQEGYVTEFSNGELQILGRPPQPPPQKQEKKPKGEKLPAAPRDAASPPDASAAERQGDDASAEKSAPAPSTPETAVPASAETSPEAPAPAAGEGEPHAPAAPEAAPGTEEPEKFTSAPQTPGNP